MDEEKNNTWQRKEKRKSEVKKKKKKKKKKLSLLQSISKIYNCFFAQLYIEYSYLTQNLHTVVWF